MVGNIKGGVVGVLVGWVAVGAACWGMDVTGGRGVTGVGICVLGGLVAIGGLIAVG